MSSSPDSTTAFTYTTTSGGCRQGPRSAVSTTNDAFVRFSSHRGKPSSPSSSSSLSWSSASRVSDPVAAPPRSFITIIDEDHSQITKLSSQFGKALSSKLAQTPELRQQQLAQLYLLAWRLVRHDFSEDVIMRPAFGQYLGQEGIAISDHDREDHERVRNELVRLHAAFETLTLTDLAGLAALRSRYAALIADLSEHMRIESGQHLPRLESMMLPTESQELGRRYLQTMVVEPGLEIAGSRVWSDVGEYIQAGLQGLRRVWSNVLLDQQRSSKL